MYDYKAMVIDVVDGDTMIVDIDLGFDIHHIHRLRVAKYDAPEVGTPLGDKAKLRAGELLLNKSVVITTKKSFNDKYGRYLCSIAMGESGITSSDYASLMKSEGFKKVSPPQD